MPRGNRILVSCQPHGRDMEGIIAAGETPKPGTIMMRDATIGLAGGRATYKIYNRDADGDRPAGGFWVLLEDLLQGKLMTDAYAAGDRCFLYQPQRGEELNLLFMNQTGTGDDIAKGDLLIVDDGTGKVFKTTGSPETEVAIALEAIVDPTADQLLWCEWAA